MKEANLTEITSEEGAVLTPVSAGKKHFSRMARDLTAAELGTTGVQKMLLLHIDRLEIENEQLSKFREAVGQALTDKAVLQQKLDVAVSADLVFGVCLTVGALLIGMTPSVWDKQPQAAIALAAGVVIMCSGIVSRWLLR